MKKHLVRIALGLVVVLAFAGHAGRYYQIPFIDRFENIVYDARLRLTMANSVDPRIVIIDIDEKSLAAEGRWPWRRDKIGTMLDQLFDRYKVGIVGFDVVFAERDESSGLGTLRELGQKELKGNAQYQAVLKDVTPATRIRSRIRREAEKPRNRTRILFFRRQIGRWQRSRIRRDTQAGIASRHVQRQEEHPFQELRRLWSQFGGISASGSQRRPFQSIARRRRRDQARSHAGGV